MSIEGRDPDGPDCHTHELRLHDRKCRVAAAIWGLSSATLDRIEPLVGIGPPPAATRPCRPDCSVCGPVYYGQHGGKPWPEAEGEG